MWSPRLCACALRLSEQLSDGHEGGETVFYPSGVAHADGARKVAPLEGAALCFWHGHHPQSLLHEGAPLRAGDQRPKYVIRTECMYATEAPPANSTEWVSTGYMGAMAMAAALGP